MVDFKHIAITLRDTADLEFVSAEELQAVIELCERFACGELVEKSRANGVGRAGFTAWDQSDGVWCEKHQEDATLCPCGPTPPGTKDEHSHLAREFVRTATRPAEHSEQSEREHCVNVVASMGNPHDDYVSVLVSQRAIARHEGEAAGYSRGFNVNKDELESQFQRERNADEARYERLAKAARDAQTILMRNGLGDLAGVASEIDAALSETRKRGPRDF